MPAIKDFTKAIELQPEFAAAYRRRTDAFKATDDMISAKLDFAKYQELIKHYKDEKLRETERSEDALAAAELPSAAKLGPAFAPLIAAWNALEKKLDGILRK